MTNPVAMRRQAKQPSRAGLNICGGGRPPLQPAGAFTLIELLVVMAIIAILAGMLLPVLARAKQAGQKSGCVSNLKQIGAAFAMYLTDYGDRFPDDRDLKAGLPGGFRPWTSWPPSDPRTGWAALALQSEGATFALWSCPAALDSPAGTAVQTVQAISADPGAPGTRYWAWRFDRTNDLSDTNVMLEDFWLKSEVQAVMDLQAANDPLLGVINGPADVELTVDAYFPKTTPTVVPQLLGYTIHPGGRNRVLLDGHAQFLNDARTPY
jgi:prepilin-type N-terminal cleavage/methylation domain-containing protein